MTDPLEGEKYRLLLGDATDVLRTLPDGCIQACVTSPPYFNLRDYQTATWEGGDPACDHQSDSKDRSTRPRNGLTGGLGYVQAQDQGNRAFRDRCGKCGAVRVDRQIGIESDPDAYIARLVAVFREVKRVLRPDGTLWLNLADGMTGKNLQGIPWRVAFALQADGWILRSEISWIKTNPMPESCRDRPTSATEKVFLFARQPSYFYDAEAVKQPSEASRPQSRRALHLARERGLTEAHLAAIRSLGMNDAGQAVLLQSGAGKNTPEVVRLALEAKALLGGYFREFLSAPSGANLRNYLILSGEPSPYRHFACMPTRLVEPCVLAGSSQRGGCSACGAPWTREVARDSFYRAQTEEQKHSTDRKTNQIGNGHGGAGRGPKNNLGFALTKSLGWKPSCSCGAETIPNVILDPFCGTATTGEVALAMGRRFLGIDLSADYLDIARQRCETLPSYTGAKRVVTPNGGQLSLLDTG